jgi:hypothetical protein
VQRNSIRRKILLHMEHQGSSPAATILWFRTMALSSYYTVPMVMSPFTFLTSLIRVNPEKPPTEGEPTPTPPSLGEAGRSPAEKKSP